MDQRAQAFSGAHSSVLRHGLGLVAGGRARRGRGALDRTWVVLARPGEGVEEFFIEDPLGACDPGPGRDPVAWICREMTTGGGLRLGTVDLGFDRLTSGPGPRGDRQ